MEPHKILDWSKFKTNLHSSRDLQPWRC